MADDRLTFYGLQAHFFSINAQVVHRCIAMSIQSANSSEDGEGSAVNLREQSQQAIGHA